MKIKVLILVMIVGGSAFGQTAGQWREDLKYFADQLPKKHKNAFHTMSVEQFNEAIADLERDIPLLQPYQITVRLLQITASVGDGHTSVHLPSEFKRYPIVTYWYGNELYVRAATKEYQSLCGMRITRVGDLSLEEVNFRLKTVMSRAENKWFDLNLSAIWISVPEILVTTGVVPSYDHATFTFIDGDGREEKRDLIPIAQDPKTTWVKAVKGTEPLYRQNLQNPFWFNYVKNINAVYVNFKKYDDLRQNANLLFDFIKEKKATRLIVDLRQNGGGDFIKGRNFLISKIKSDPVLNQKGHLYVISGRYTYSAAMVNTIDFKKETNAIVIGEPPGERPNSYSENDEMTLPNSRIVVSYSTKYYQFLEKDVDAFEVDIRIDPDWQSFVDGRDPVMERIVADCLEN